MTPPYLLNITNRQEQLMRSFLSIAALCLLLTGFQLPSNAEVKIDETLKNNFSYINLEPQLKQDAVNLLLLEEGKQKLTTENKPEVPSQCFAMNKAFVNCLH